MTDTERDKIMKTSKKKARTNLLKTMSCPVATLMAMEELTKKQDDVILQAAKALAGGLGGLTCGVPFGGSLGIALLHEEALRNEDIGVETAVTNLAGDFVKWFTETYGSAYCMDRVKVSFDKVSGLIRYMLPGDKALKCLIHIGKSIEYLYDLKGRPLKPVEYERESGKEGAKHCARAVLKAVRDQTGVGSELLERVSVVLDGGVGLQGGACGAMAAAAMAVCMLSTVAFREMGIKNGLTLVSTQVKALQKSAANKPKKAYHDVSKSTAMSKILRVKFIEQAASVECRSITGKAFESYKDFQKYIGASDKCEKLINFITTETVKLINISGLSAVAGTGK